MGRNPPTPLSTIDDLILRDRDAVQPGTNTDPADTWSFASDGTLEERVFLCQSWRADLVLVLDDAGDVEQRAWYSPYGVPTGADGADLDGDGDVDGTDQTIQNTWKTNSDPRGDWNLDGSYSTLDNIAYLGAAAAAYTFGGRGALTAADLDIRVGYAGYQWDAEIGKYHVRNRVYDPYAGRWINRDPLRYYARSWNLYEYLLDSPVGGVDPLGLQDPGWTRRDEYDFWRDLFKRPSKPRKPSNTEQILQSFGEGAWDGFLCWCEGAAEVGAGTVTLGVWSPTVRFPEEWKFDPDDPNLRVSRGMGMVSGVCLELACGGKGLKNAASKAKKNPMDDVPTEWIDDGWRYERRRRPTPGRDGGESDLIIERDPFGNPTSRWHVVTKDGEMVHCHQSHFPRDGGLDREFPLEWWNDPPFERFLD